MTSSRNRYRVRDIKCGQVRCFKRKVGAIGFAQAHRKSMHSSDGVAVTVFDALAHSGDPELFDSNWTILEYKP